MLLRRLSMTAWYSGDWYHANAASRDGNSSTTTRSPASPSSTVASLVTTRGLMLWPATVAPAAAPYSSSRAWSVMVALTTM